MIGVASVHLHRGSLPQARDIYGQALELARATQSRYPEVVTLVGLATTDQRVGRHDQALVVADQGLTLAREAGFRALEGLALTALAGICLDRQQPDQVAEHARQAALGILTAIGLPQATRARLPQPHQARR